MRKKAFILFLVSLLLISSCCPAVYAAENSSFTVIKDLPYDFGSTMEYDGFSEGYAVVSKYTDGGPKYGLIDINGNEVIAPKYDYMETVHEGMAVIGMNTDGNRYTGTNGVDKYGFVNTNGVEVVPPTYDAAYRFSDGRAAVTNKLVSGTITWGDYELPVIENLYGFIDKTGKMVIPMEYSSCASFRVGTGGYNYVGFSDGLACVSKDGKYGAIDVNGNVVIPFTFQSLHSFHEGLAYFSDYNKNTAGFVDKTGKQVFSLDYNANTTVDFFSNGLCRVLYRNGQYPRAALIDKKGNTVFSIEHGHINEFSDGLALVAKHDNDGPDAQYGYVDTSGKLVIPYMSGVVEASDFSDGMAVVKVNDGLIGHRQTKSGYIDKSGALVIPYQYATAYSFVNGTAVVETGTVSYIHLDALTGDYTAAEAKIKELGIPYTHSVIDKTGKVLISLKRGDSLFLSDDENIIYRNYTNGSNKLIKNPFYDPNAAVSKPSAPPAAETARPTSSTVLINGIGVSFEAYNINGSNYFKLRDLAQALRGTEKQFEVTWDGTARAINLISNKAYTSVGGELAKGDGTQKTARLNTSAIYMDGKQISLTAYTINGSNFFKLRDLGVAFDFDVSWDGAKNTIVVDTSKGYTDG